MDLAVTPVLELLGYWMNHLDINDGTGDGGVGVGMPELVEFEYK